MRARRRGLVLGLLVLALVGSAAALAMRRVLPQRVRTGAQAAHGATVARYSIDSRYAGATLRQVAVAPPGGGRGRPLLVFLHGRGGGEEESNANADFMAALAAQGSRAPNVVLPSGGDHSYWHDRQGGRWTEYVLREVIPAAIRRLGADPHRVAIGGISMGGFGAFDIARHAPGRFCAVGGHSAAVWLTGGETAPGAFDDAEDFARNDLVKIARTSGRRSYGGARLWLDGGTDDPFRPGDTAFAAALGMPLHHWPGGHDGAYWHAHYARYLRFYADALAAC
jgi:S-formylglutathione hydrolase FrmB